MIKPKVNLSNKKVIIVTHRSNMPSIPGGDLKKFLLTENCNELIYIAHPLLLLQESYKFSSEFEYFKKSKQLKSKAYHWLLPEPLSYVKDSIYTLLWILRTRQTFDIYFGINNLNALNGLLLKKIGRVKKVVYYTIDLYPQRFGNKIINWIYHKVDRLCVEFCDETWNVSLYLSKYRAKKGAIGKVYSRQYNVPIGIWFNQVKRVPTNKINRNKIVFKGHLMPFRGVDLAIKAMPLIIKKIPNIRLEIIGGGEQLKELQQLAYNLRVSKHVKFYGFVSNEGKAEKLISDAVVGLAPYNSSLANEQIKNADPAKIKDYLSLGIPVITTDAIISAKEISKAKCGIIIEFTPESLANAVYKLVSSEKLRLKYRKNSLQYINQFDWNYLFTKNISRLL